MHAPAWAAPSPRRRRSFSLFPFLFFFTFACCATTTRGRRKKKRRHRFDIARKSGNHSNEVLDQKHFSPAQFRLANFAPGPTPSSGVARKSPCERPAACKKPTAPLTVSTVPEPFETTSPAPSRAVPLDCESLRVCPQGCGCKLCASSRCDSFFEGGCNKAQFFFLGFFFLSVPSCFSSTVQCAVLHARITSKGISRRIYRGREIIPSVE